VAALSGAESISARTASAVSGVTDAALREVSHSASTAGTSS
jgi:hypothetical protein